VNQHVGQCASARRGGERSEGPPLAFADHHEPTQGSDNLQRRSVEKCRIAAAKGPAPRR
jgi:hypothetical protein